jgi:hypothetical protein
MKAAPFLAALALAACSAPGSSLSTIPLDAAGAPRTTHDIFGGAPSMRVMLYDAPIAGMPGVKVNIAINGVQLVTALGSAVPFVTNEKPEVVNLLDLQKDPEVFNGKAPAGAYTKLPIVWGTPGHATTAPVIAVDFPCSFVLATKQGAPLKVSLDFNILHSVKFANGTIYVKPSVSAAGSAAQVTGMVLNSEGEPVTSAAVLAVDALGRVVNSTITGSDGSFAIHALPAGIYSIQVKNSYVTALGETVTAVGADGGTSPSTTVILSPDDNVKLPAFVD